MRRQNAWISRVAASWLFVLFVHAVDGPRAQQTGSAPAPKAIVPVAASSVAADPEAHVGTHVTLMGAVDERFSRIVFSVDQDPSRSAAGAGGKALDVIVIAPTLNAEVPMNAYVTVIGDVIRFESAEIARLASDYSLELAADVVERYRGRPAILATSVITQSLVDLAKRPPPPMTAEEEAFSQIMKRVGPAFTALRQAVAVSNADDARANTAILRKAFSEVETFWKSKGKADATAWAGDARKHADSVERSAGFGNWDAVKSSTTTLGQSCQNCHTAYRERLEDGSFRFKR